MATKRSNRLFLFEARLGAEPPREDLRLRQRIVAPDLTPSRNLPPPESPALPAGSGCQKVGAERRRSKVPSRGFTIGPKPKTWLIAEHQPQAPTGQGFEPRGLWRRRCESQAGERPSGRVTAGPAANAGQLGLDARGGNRPPAPREGSFLASLAGCLKTRARRGMAGRALGV